MSELLCWMCNAVGALFTAVVPRSVEAIKESARNHLPTAGVVHKILRPVPESGNSVRAGAAVNHNAMLPKRHEAARV
jgi:hypothetical protein